MDQQRGMRMYIDQQIIDELKQEYGIEYVVGLENNKDVQAAIGHLWDQRLAREGSSSLTLGGQAETTGELEEY